jgi:hypothetical protein
MGTLILLPTQNHNLLISFMSAEIFPCQKIAAIFGFSAAITDAIGSGLMT